MTKSAMKDNLSDKPKVTSLEAGASPPYKAGDRVSHSGVYRVIHADGSPPTQVVMLRDETVVACSKCGDKVRFRLVQRAPHILEDEDFK